MRRRPQAARARLSVVLLMLGAAPGCSDDNRLAELTSVIGSAVVRDHAQRVGDFRRAQLHEHFYLGDGLRTGEGSQAELELTPSGTLHVEPHSVLRFLPRAPEVRSTRVSLERGELLLSAEQIDLEVHTPRAVARVARGGKLKLSAVGGQERFDLVVGRVVVAHAGSTRTLVPAQPLELGEVAAAPEPPPPLGTSEPPVAPATEPAATTSSWPAPSPGTADVILDRLERATIHATRLPVDVYLPLPPCNAQPRLLLDGKPFSAQQQGVARRSAGRHVARLFCGSRLAREVPLSVERDEASMELPKRAQQARVEADGRSYTIRYQNLLPTVSLVWPDAPAGDLFTLVLRSGRREASYQVSEPEHTLHGDALREGEYKFWFLDAKGRSSRLGTLRLAFDNTARSAYLSSPAEDSAPSAEGVLVAGAALAHSEVSVAGLALHLDNKGRFRAEAPVAAGQRAVAVRVAHPEGGVHYYLRRLR
jgi:hypothetical protein